MKPIVASKTSKEHVVLTLIIMSCMFLHACKKNNDQYPDPPPHDSGTKVGKLKDLVAEHLPSPFYHFDYTDKGITTDISFASGLLNYKLSYKNGKLDKMTNIFNRDVLFYYYNGSQVKFIRNIKPNGRVVWNYSFEYNAGNQLTEVRWYRFNDAGTDSTLLRKSTLEYFADGNLSQYEDYRNTTGPLEWSGRYEFSDYDGGTNVDDFSVLKDFFDNVLYLPGVRLQKNNPRKLFITSLVNDYDITYTWTYQNNLPVNKSSKFILLRGSGSKDPVIAGTTYSYY